ncbi:DUF5602 domain-containing protein [Pleomorphovibrio marinus]|uniref:DUF5602 domain-containing protein n=1 Tax=Pleomorphovibrio marinus TaxID=2164132 RepID=UPI0013008BB1|nr:DUF5602 domain-containing protein [Pleomorphovibrio marinus]
MNKLTNYSMGWVAAFLLVLILSSCELFEKQDTLVDRESSKDFITYLGPVVQLGNGRIQSFITYNKSRIPTALGIKMSEKSMENLPSGSHVHHSSNEFVLKLHKKAETTPYKNIVVNWEPEGHEPQGVYDLPHFDFHFYTISEEERQQISGLAPDQMDLEIPLAKYLPENYVQLPGRAPKMGVHWLNPMSPELHGETFTKTLIYGTSKGKVAFLEPMITLDYIKSKPNLSEEFPQPEAVEVDAYYPKKYHVGYDMSKKEYLIYLTDFELRRAE